MALLNTLIDLAKKVAAVIAPNSAPPLIAAGEAVIEHARQVRASLSSDDQAALDAALEPLLAKMNRDVDQAIRDLRGG